LGKWIFVDGCKYLARKLTDHLGKLSELLGIYGIALALAESRASIGAISGKVILPAVSKLRPPSS